MPSGFSKHTDCLLHQPSAGYSEKEEKIQCFKYDSKDNPLTILYCPWWAPPKVAKSAKLKDTGCLLLQKRQDPETQDYFLLDYGEKDQKDKNKGYSVICKSVLRGSCRQAFTLGLEIFGGNAIASTKKGTLLTVDALLAKNPPSISKAPGLYIVGTRTAVLGALPPKTFIKAVPRKPNAFTNETSNKDTLAPEFDSDIPIATPQDGHDVGVINERGLGKAKLASDDNANSLLLMLIWQDPTGNAASECTLYTGGDAEWQTERNLAYWVSQSNKTVKCVKVGHHGSRKGTSLLFLRTLIPEHILISASYIHGHPGKGKSSVILFVHLLLIIVST